jgi:hypothetical protein
VLAIGWDDVMPLLLILGAAFGVWAFNALKGARPGRRGRGIKRPQAPHSPK